MKIKFNAQSKAPPPPPPPQTYKIDYFKRKHVCLVLTGNTINMHVCQGRIYGGGGGSEGLNPPEIFRFFFEKCRKQIERKRRKKGCWGRGYLLTYFWG